MNYLELLQGAVLRELASAIKKNQPEFAAETATAEDVFANLEYIYEEAKEVTFGKETGRVLRYMPKRYKEMVMRLISPTSSFLYDIASNDAAVTVTAKLYYDRLDEKPVTIGTATVSMQSLEGQSMSDYEKKRSVEAIAKGQAESKALQRFGIGSWFNYELEENPELMLEQAKQKADFAPVAPPKVAATQEVPVVSEPVSVQTEEEDITNAPKRRGRPPKDVQADVAQDTQEAVQKTADVPVQTGAMSLSEARNIVCPIGRAAGRTLGEIEQRWPANITWLYEQPDCPIKDALEIIIRSSSDLMARAAEKGIIL